MTGRLFLLTLAGLVMASGMALAAGLSDGDYRYLDTEFGLKRDGAFLRSLDAGEQTRLDAAINDPATVPYAISRRVGVGDYLYGLATCHGWDDAHPGQACPRAPRADDAPGKVVADRQCSACHLFGTSDAPAFHRLAEANWDSKRLAAALQSGHRMSPIRLSDTELAALITYIDSFK